VVILTDIQDKDMIFIGLTTKDKKLFHMLYSDYKLFQPFYDLITDLLQLILRTQRRLVIPKQHIIPTKLRMIRTRHQYKLRNTLIQ